MTESLNPIKVLVFEGKIEKGSLRLNELFVNYSRHYSHLQEGSWQMMIRDITYVSTIKEKSKSAAKFSTYFSISSNFILSVNEHSHSIKTPLLTCEYRNYGSNLFHNPHDYWYYLTDVYHNASIKFDFIMGEQEYNPFDVKVTALFRRIN